VNTENLSRLDLQNAKLDRLSRIANLRRELKWDRDRLRRDQDEMRLLKGELRKIEEALTVV
jgi:hypothetical protein